MELKITDFNDSETVLSTTHMREWQEVETVLSGMPLHLKASDQNRKQGSFIFDPVGTNAYIKTNLSPHQWLAANILPEHAFLGIDVDFAKEGVILEAQFSNYPFLLNNLLRSELFFRERVSFVGTVPLAVVIIIVKAAMFPASNSTLYYEQALKQLNGLAKFKLFSVPLRLVGLFSPIEERVPATFTTYSAARYSRTINEYASILCDITSGRADRCKITRSSGSIE